jgi:hypothetical protein
VALADSYPPLARYCPILERISLPQARFLVDDCREALYGGAVGGGKSAALLTAALQFVDVKGYRALILRRTYAELSKGDALIPLSQEWLGGKDARWNEQRKTWTFPSGSTIEFGHVQHEEDKRQYQGAAYHFVGFDELTHFSESQYDFIAFSRQRRRTEFATIGVPVRVRSTANPGGIGHAWVKRRFIDNRKPEVLFVPARIWDNPGLDAADYAASLAHLPDALRAQLLDGDWGAFEGMAYPEFSKDVHCLPRLPIIPDTWLRWESMDVGLSNPTAWLAWALDYDGNAVIFDSYYQPGYPSDIAPLILQRRKDGWEAKDEDGYPRHHPCYGDPASIRERLSVKDQWGEPLTLQDEYERHGVHVAPANNRRQAGYVRLAEMLKPDPTRPFPRYHPRYGELGAPRLFVVESESPELVEQLAAAPVAMGENDPLRGEAVDGKWEGQHGHAHAALRYGALTWFGESKPPEPVEADPRRAAAKRLRSRLHFAADRVVDLT